LSIVNAADDGVFGAFCKRIKVTNIREYEDVQLKVAKEESDAMEAFASQHARVRHQYV
jgi:structural maintenance of chromosome 1